MITISSTMRERRLREAVRAIRHLPPGTSLPHPSNPEIEQLLDDLVDLPDEVDPLGWLQAERDSQVAGITLLLQLQDLRRTIVEARLFAEKSSAIHESLRLEPGSLGQNPWFAFHEEDQALLGEILERPEADEAFASLDSLSGYSPEPLIRTFRELQVLRGRGPERVVAPTFPDERHDLLIELFGLPDTVDPLSWLETERGAVAARIGLDYVLHQSLPRRTLEVGPVTQRWRPPKQPRSPKGVRIRVEELVFGQDGFMLSADIRLSKRALSLPARVVEGGYLSGLVWPGFDRVIDNCGNHYLVRCVHEGGLGEGILWWLQHLQMSFYPALAPNASELKFMACPMTLVLTSLHVPAGRLQELPDRDIADLVWDVVVPGRGRPAVSTAG